jgi:hypothetical protein
MPLPTLYSDLMSFGFTKLPNKVPGKPAHCYYCDREIEWWSTPKKRTMPFEVAIVEGVEHRRPHFGNCPKFDEARKSKNGGKQ